MITYNGEEGTPYSFCPHKCGQCSSNATGTNTGAESSTESNTGSNGDMETGKGSNTGSNGNAETGIGSDTESNTESNTGSNEINEFTNGTGGTSKNK